MVCVNSIKSNLAKHIQMKAIQSWLPAAIDVAKARLLRPDKTDSDIPKIDKEFNGYISSFGASVIAAGILPSVIFFSQKGDSASDRNLIIDCIEDLMKKKHYIRADDGLLKKIKILIETNDRAELNRLTEKIGQAAIALKLAIRTFPKTK